MSDTTALTPQDLEQRLQMPHLDAPSPESMRAAIEKAEQPPAQKATGDPKSEREYTFQVDWKDTRGKRWQGTFTNKVLSIWDRRRVGTMRAQLAGNVPAEALDSMTTELNLMLAHLTHSLQGRPDWAKNLGELTDVALLQAIFAEVASHEARFLGFDAPEGASKRQPE